MGNMLSTMKENPASADCSSPCDKRKYYRNPYINFFVRLFDQERFRGKPASEVAKYAGKEWNTMSEDEKKGYRDMAAHAPKQSMRSTEQKDVEDNRTEAKTKWEQDGIGCEALVTGSQECDLPMPPWMSTSSRCTPSRSTCVETPTCITKDPGHTSQSEESSESAVREAPKSTCTRSNFCPSSSIEDSPSTYTSSPYHFKPITRAVACRPCSSRSDSKRKSLAKRESVKRKLSFVSVTESEEFFQPIAKRTRKQTSL